MSKINANYLSGRTESYRKTFQTSPFCMISWRNMEAIFRCSCLHLLKHILNCCKKILKSFSLLNKMPFLMLILGAATKCARIWKNCKKGNFCSHANANNALKRKWFFLFVWYQQATFNGKPVGARGSSLPFH